MPEDNLAPCPSSRRAKRTLVLGLIVGLAFGLRLFHLGHQELRGDEAFDALFAAQPIAAILEQFRLEQPYPPLFHVTLHFWLELVGQNEVMQRLPALLSGVLLVPLVYQVGRLMLGESTGLIGAALVAINPFYIWHAQDGRMYSLLAMWSLASLYLALRLLQGDSSIRISLGYWAVTILSLLTHYFAWWLLLAENIVAVLILWKDNRAGTGRDNWRSRVAHWLKLQIAVCLVLLPWLTFASGLLGSHTSGWIQALSVLEALRRCMTAYSVGQTLAPAAALPFALGTGTLFVLGCVFPSRPVGPGFRFSGRGLLLLCIAVPLLATLLLSLARPAFDEKYLIALAALYLIFVAHGLHFLATRQRVAATAAVIVLLVGSGWSLYNYYFDSDYAKSPKWRSLVQEIGSGAQAGDVILQNYPDPGLTYYYRGMLPIRLVPATESAPPERIGRALDKLAAGYRRIWLIPGPDQIWDHDRIVSQWLQRHTELVDDRTVGLLHLQLYQTPQAFLEGMNTVHVALGDQIELLGYRLHTVAPPATTPPTGVLSSPTGDIAVTLYWQALAPVDADYTVFVHLADPTEQLWGQHDGQPVAGTYSTSQWQPGQIVVDSHIVKIGRQPPPGTYRLMVGLYNRLDGQRLGIQNASHQVDTDRVLLTTLEVDD